MTDDVAKVLRPPPGGAAVSGIAYDEVATGGTLFANPLSMAAARAALTEVLTPDAFITTATLGDKLAAGLRAHIDRVGLPWSVNAHGSHLLLLQPATPEQCARRPGNRRPWPACAHPPIPRQPWHMGVGLVARPHRVGRAHTRGRAGIPRRDRGVHTSRDLTSPNPHPHRRPCSRSSATPHDTTMSPQHHRHAACRVECRPPASRRVRVCTARSEPNDQRDRGVLAQ
jgi:hypothetical protein